MKKVYLHIDRLVLRVFSGLNRDAIAEGLRGELARQLVNDGTLAKLTARAHVPLRRVQGVTLDRDLTPEQIGVSLARGIGRGDKP